MNITVDLQPELENVIAFTFKPGWTWDDFFAGLDIEKNLLSSFNGERYDVIANFEATSSVPVGNAIGHVRRSLETARKYNRGLTVVVSKSGYIRALVNTLVRMVPAFRDSFIAVDSLSEAFEIIKRSREMKSEVKSPSQ